MKIQIFAITLLRKTAVLGLAVSSLAGCGEGEISDSNTYSVENTRKSEEESAYAPMEEIRTAVKEILGENYWPDKQLTAQELETETGITKDMYDEYLAESMNVETDIDTMIVIKTKQEKIEEVEVLLNEYRDALMVKYRDRPQELGKVEASRIEMIDSYICFVQLGADTAEAAKAGDEKVLALCQQENERAVDMIEKTILDQ